MADESRDHRQRRRFFGRRRSDETPSVPSSEPAPDDEPATDAVTSEPTIWADPSPATEPPIAAEPDQPAGAEVTNEGHPMDEVVAPPVEPALDENAEEPAPAEPVDFPDPEPEGSTATEVVIEEIVAEDSGPDLVVVDEIVAEEIVVDDSGPDLVVVDEIVIEEIVMEVAPDEAPATAEAESSDEEAILGRPEDTAALAAATADRRDAPPVLTLPRVIAVANQKGGVGKTTTAVNLGAALAERGFRVLVVDLDPQGNATTGLGVSPRDVEASIYDVIMNDVPALDVVEPTSLKNLFVIPATLDLAGAEIELVPAFSREQKLRRALDAVRSEYDIVLIDCPPSLGLLTVNGLAAADDVIVPIQCEYYALEGLGQLLRNVALVRTNLNPTLEVRGIVLTMHDTRTRLADQVETEVRDHFGATVYDTVVPRTVRLAEAPSFGQPIIVFDPTSRGAKAYRKLAKEVSRGATRRAG
jgi:chromosome partitioning protein